MYPSNVHRGSYRFLRASYTAGSMAGLGFSMAILGICIGIFLGFLLWKRRLGAIPYYLSQWHRAGPEEVAAAATAAASASGSDFGLLNSHQYPTSQSLVSDLPTFDASDQLTTPILVPMSPPHPPPTSLNLSLPSNNRRYWYFKHSEPKKSTKYKFSAFLAHFKKKKIERFFFKKKFG